MSVVEGDDLGKLKYALIEWILDLKEITACTMQMCRTQSPPSPHLHGVQRFERDSGVRILHLVGNSTPYPEVIVVPVSDADDGLEDLTLSDDEEGDGCTDDDGSGHG